MHFRPINLKQKFDCFSESFSPKIIARMNDIDFKLVRFQGEFVWHKHKDTDETFMVIDGELRIDFRNGKVDLKTGEMFVVPKGVEHKPFAEKECRIMLIEPAGTVNTGDAGDTRGGLTAKNEVWI